MATFLTGATGFLGRYLLRDLLASGEEVVTLVRAANAADGRARVLQALDALGPRDAEWAERVHACPGALDKPGLGLSDTDRELVLERCESFLHCGASVRFDLSLEAARQVNVHGTRCMLELARVRQKRATLARFDHVSTAYVAGNRTDRVLESELDASAGHKNSYERSKYESETLVRSAMAELPIAIFRPSIVVGAAADGNTSSFNVIYWPIRVYSSGLWRICPGVRETPIDIVPVDFVCNALMALRRRPESLGRCFHLAAGPDGAKQLGELTELVRNFFAVDKPVRFVEPGLWMRWVHPVLKFATFGASRRVIRAGEFYVPYFCSNPIFDVQNTLELLAATNIAIPRVADYVEQMFRFCVETDWGKKARPA